MKKKKLDMSYYYDIPIFKSRLYKKYFILNFLLSLRKIIMINNIGLCAICTFIQCSNLIVWQKYEGWNFNIAATLL